MTPDMNRLCRAANLVVRGREPSEDCGPLPEGRIEHIVSAVLEQLAKSTFGSTTISSDDGSVVEIDGTATQQVIAGWIDKITGN